MITNKLFLLAGFTLLLALGCSTQHKVEVAPVKVEPIHITIDVNVKVDKALDDFFSDVDDAEDTIEADPPAAE